MIFKRLFDVFFSVIGIVLLFPVLIICYIICSFDTQSNGLFLQNRIGQFGKPFIIFKFKTINPKNEKISKIGFLMRKYKLDEFPQLVNVLFGTMSFVGFRPDVEGYYDELIGEDKKILLLKPGITSLASIKYANEEFELSQQENPKKYNDEIIFPDKLMMNLEYYYNQSFLLDLKIICKTFFK